MECWKDKSKNFIESQNGESRFSLRRSEDFLRINLRKRFSRAMIELLFGGVHFKSENIWKKIAVNINDSYSLRTLLQPGNRLRLKLFLLCLRC